MYRHLQTFPLGLIVKWLKLINTQIVLMFCRNASGKDPLGCDWFILPDGKQNRT